MDMNSLSIRYPSEILWALQQEPDEFEENARLLLALVKKQLPVLDGESGALRRHKNAKLLLNKYFALKLYETGKLSTGLAARMAGMPRVTFMFLLGQHGLSAFGETVDELAEDLSRARQAHHCQ